MRIFFGLFFASFLITLPVFAEEGAMPEKPIAVFILAGQSNMVGQGDGSELPEALQKGSDRVLRWVDGEWQPLRPILPANENFKKRGIVGPTFGPEISFGEEMAKALPDRRVGIVKVAVGGTGILAWSPNWTKEQADRSRDGKKGDLYKKIIDQVEAIRKNEPVELTGFFWKQGGKDMRYPDLSNEYAANLKLLIASLREDLSEPELPAFISVPFDPSSIEGKEKDSPEMQMILAARPGALEVAHAWANAGKDIPHTVSVAMPSLPKWPKNVHYNTAGCLEAGRLFAKAYLESKRAVSFMVSPGAEIFSEQFEDGSVSERWGIRAHFVANGGVLKRSGHDPAGTARVFLKDAVFRNVVIRFDFQFNGASEIRLMTGGGGGYNTVIQISPRHFQVNTAKRGDEHVPSFQGECAFDFQQGEWQTMTVEFHGDEVVAYVDGTHFVVGRHPIIDVERTYLAFQVSGTSAEFDNFSMHEAVRSGGWKPRREKLLEIQAARSSALTRDAKEEYDLIMLRLKDRLSRTDPGYQALVTAHAKLKAAQKSQFPEAFQTHKELSKSIAKRRIERKKTAPRFKEMEGLVNKARKAEKEYIHARFPVLDALPPSAYYARFEESRRSMADDPRLAELKARTIRHERELHAAYPELFQDVSVLVDERNDLVASMKNDTDFKAMKDEISVAYRAINDYLYASEPRLARLAEARAAIIKAKGP